MGKSHRGMDVDLKEEERVVTWQYSGVVEKVGDMTGMKGNERRSREEKERGSK